MDDQCTARLRAHQRNVDRYNNMLKTRLTATERHFVEKRLSEERFAISMLQFMSPPPGHQTGIDLPDALQ